MSSGKDIDSLLDADPDALDVVVRFMDARVTAPEVTGLEAIIALQTEQGRVQAAYETGRRSMVDELIAAQKQAEEEAGNG